MFEEFYEMYEQEEQEVRSDCIDKSLYRGRI